MNKGLRDKLFFVDHIDNWQLLVDFGTARGDLIKAVLPYEPNAHYIGYDISPEMISQAISNVGEEENIQFTDKWPEVAQAVQITQGTSILVLNSVLHEVFSYSSPKEYSKFWGQALKSGFSYISLRDMMPN
jgi:tRNA G46 methylase TrmB